MFSSPGFAPAGNLNFQTSFIPSVLGVNTLGIISLFDEFDFIKVIAEAVNGMELLEYLKTLKPDLILLDIEMPVMDGSETLNHLSKKHPEIPVIILSQYPDEVLIDSFLSQDARAYLNKNTDIEIIIETVTRVINSPANVKFNKSHNGIFTPREEEIIPLLCNAQTSHQIANHLSIAVKTVEAHRKRLFQKTNTNSIQEFIKLAMSKGLHFLKKRN